MVLAGGGALGAFEAGAYAVLEEVGEPLPDWFSSASVGAVNAAIMAGNPPGRRVERLPPELHDDPEVASILAEAENGARSATVLCLGYRAAPDEARPGEVFDFSPATLADRWEAGARGMREVLRRFGASSGTARPARGLVVHEVDA